jgi:hypothetical protein
MRLRTGVLPELGGWRKGFEDCCPLCHVALSRDEGKMTGVEHFLSCPEAAAVDERARLAPPGTILELGDLWESTKWPSILQYLKLFVVAAIAQRNGTVGALESL